MLKNNFIELKGSVFTLLVLYIKNKSVSSVQNAILEKIMEAPQFFKNAPIVINVSSLSNTVNWNDMQKSIISTGLHIIGVSGCIDKILKCKIIKSGIPILLEGKNEVYCKQKNQKNNKFINKKKFNTKIINTPVRSGQKIYVNQSNLIVTNHVNPGAELIADGDIHIYGMMRGRVLAGVNGDKTRNIFCTQLFAELISISGEYLLIDQIPLDLLGKSVHIFLKNNILLIYPLT
ncbi:septum site-determining protein MinC [Buchnera aphidicola]|uniref:septum site-determining protein MinC n=1 Tax=Buchnera aphidicola TaxID=9 RepID=UPI0034641124